MRHFVSNVATMLVLALLGAIAVLIFTFQVLPGDPARVIAGPLANFLLAIAVYWGLFIGGVQEAKPIIAGPLCSLAA